MSFDERAHFRLKTGRDSCPSARICPRLVTLTDSTGSTLSNEKSEIRNQKSEIRNKKSEIRNQKSEIRNQKSEIRTEYSRPEIKTNGGRFRALRTARRAVEDGRL